MPLKLNIGLSRKVGEANYGSRGASVNVELEVDGSLVSEPAKLQDRIRQCFNLVRTSLNEELNGGNGSNGHGHTDPRPQTTANGNDARVNGSNGNNPRPATQSQVKAIHAIAKRHRINIAPFLRQRYSVDRPDDLDIKQASEVIDELKSAATSNGS